MSTLRKCEASECRRNDKGDCKSTDIEISVEGICKQYDPWLEGEERIVKIL